MKIFVFLSRKWKFLFFSSRKWKYSCEFSILLSSFALFSSLHWIGFPCSVLIFFRPAQNISVFDKYSLFFFLQCLVIFLFVCFLRVLCRSCTTPWVPENCNMSRYFTASLVLYCSPSLSDISGWRDKSAESGNLYNYMRRTAMLPSLGPCCNERMSVLYIVLYYTIHCIVYIILYYTIQKVYIQCNVCHAYAALCAKEMRQCSGDWCRLQQTFSWKIEPLKILPGCPIGKDPEKMDYSAPGPDCLPGPNLPRIQQTGRWRIGRVVD